MSGPLCGSFTSPAREAVDFQDVLKVVRPVRATSQHWSYPILLIILAWGGSEMFASWILPAAVTLVLVLTLWLLPSVTRYVRNRKLYYAIPMPKYIPCHWLLGHIPTLSKRDEALFMKVVQEVNEGGKDQPDLLRFHVGPIVSVAVMHSKHIGLFLKEPKGNIYDILLPWLGEGLLIAGGEKWFRNRKLLTPAFHYSILTNYVSIYNSCVSKMLKKWHVAATGQKSVEVFQSISAMSLDIILQTAFSFKSGCQEDKTQHPYVVACSQLVKQVSQRSLNPFYRINWIYWLTAHGRKMKALCNIVHSHAEGVISERRAKLAEDQANGEEGSVSSRKHHDFLDILLLARDEEGKGLSDIEIRNEVDTFMFEGHDTTTSGMSWTLYCLAQHPEHQQKIREEVRSVLNGRDEFEYEDLKSLNYTMWCIKEAMRLYPPVFNFFRTTSKDIQVGKYLLPEGSMVGIGVFTIHHNSDIWENPMEYNPLRFQPGNVEKHGPYDYIPFSAGSRNCIGQNFAMNEMKVVIGSVINQFKLTLDDSHGVDLQSTVVLRTKNDIKIYLEKMK